MSKKHDIDFFRGNIPQTKKKTTGDDSNVNLEFDFNRKNSSKNGNKVKEIPIIKKDKPQQKPNINEIPIHNKKPIFPDYQI